MNYELHNSIALISIDDGKANAVGHNFLDEMNAALDRAQSDTAGAVVLRGREGVFSAGFDLGEFKNAADGGISMVSKGMQLLIRLYSFPLPLVAACTGHAVAMGAFILLACDTRVGVRGAFRLTLPETAIGMEIPRTMLELAASRISHPYLTRVAIQAEVFNPELAVEAGFLDEIVDAQELDQQALAAAEKLAVLPRQHYAANKLGVRKKVLAAMTAEFEKLAAQHA